MGIHKCKKCSIKGDEITAEGMLCGVCRFELNSPLNSKKDAVADVTCNVVLKGRLITATASLSLHKLSELDDDYPQRFPKRVLREIEKHNDHLRGIARELMSIKNAL